MQVVSRELTQKLIDAIVICVANTEKYAAQNFLCCMYEEQE